MTQDQKNVNKTIVEMFESRKYTNIQYSDENGNIKGVSCRIIGNYHITATKPDGTTIVAFATIIPNFDIDRVREIVRYMKQYTGTVINHCIVIYEKTTPPVKSSIVTLRRAKDSDIHANIEIFTSISMQFNITTHELQPKFTPLTHKESVHFKKEHGVEYPIMLRSDPVAKYYGVESGSVMKIMRKSGIIAYRLVR